MTRREAGEEPAVEVRETAVEREKEIQWQEVSEEELAKYGWKYKKRIDNNVFTALVIQGMDFNQALFQGRIYARHQKRNTEGILRGFHIDNLGRDTWGEEDILVTKYNPSVEAGVFVVLEKLDK